MNLICVGNEIKSWRKPKNISTFVASFVCCYLFECAEVPVEQNNA